MNVRLLILAVLAALVIGVSAAAAATIVGTNGPDRLHGTAFADRIDGKAGNDAIFGHAGDDLLVGGLGNDSLWNGYGRDYASGGPGDDVLHALADDNQLDTLDCGPGTDTAYLNAAERARTIGCEKVITLSPADAAAQAAAEGDN
jgi:Ca2+-binding RTX toxin-like protein